ncbi:thioredoxin reductase [Aquipluma nitroreducens]|uniref:Thioredoxin reductase n=1 Tax=Aquipluma nitroreducens TaxID=2010828 RepID=A0A5K7S923_9BACT|nr:NAD(P)-binding domain-containing protein [Aquipluma nitroreducens]BBE18061.1 thioredoxin reductase [Aquipluma nitroreducens]
MEVLTENIIIYSFIAILFVSIVYFYVRKEKKNSKIVEEKIKIAKEEGLHEPVSLHPVVDVNSCIQTGACISACPEHDILGILNGKATTINASHCVGHGACFHACPTHAITLCIGTEKRGVDIPHVDQSFETNVPGIYIAGEIGGMGLIRNAVEQGKQAVENLAKKIDKHIQADYDIIIIGAGPAGISASLTAKKHNLKAITLEQDSLGGTVFTFPRKKIVMTSPMDIPLYGKVKLRETTKMELLDLWNNVLGKNEIVIKEQSKVESIVFQDKRFVVETASKEQFTTRKVLLSIGRRGTPRKLNIPGEVSEKVAYRLLEPELISNKKIVVVGGGDSAIETALLLMDQNQVTLSYRGESFGRIKVGNNQKIKEAIAQKQIDVRFNTNLKSIEDDKVKIVDLLSGEVTDLGNDLVYIFAGGELPTQFLEKAGIKVDKKFGEAVLKHD